MLRKDARRQIREIRDVNKGNEDLLSKFKPFLRATEVAKILGISPATVYRWVISGDIEAVTIGRVVRIPSHVLVSRLQDDE